MNSILRKLSGPPRSLADMADLLETHIGDGTNEFDCKEALEALCRVRKDNPSCYFRIALRCLDGDGTPYELVRNVVATLRRWRHHSGFS